MTKAYLLVALLALVVADAHPAKSAQNIGTAAIIQNNVTGTPEDATSALALHRGDGLFANERVATAKDSKAQLLFLDQTALSMAPESTIVLDKFVYNPNSNAGTVILKTISGAFRFIGGVADTTPGSSYTVKTPVGTIGIRGTYFEWAVKGDYLWALLRQGAIEVCLTDNECGTLNRPGTYLVTRGAHLSDIRHWNGPGADAGANVDSDDLYLTYLESLLAALPPGVNAGQPNGDFPGPPTPPPTGAGGPPPTPPPTGAGGAPPPPPPPPPPLQTGFPPLLTGAGNVPPGLAQRIDATGSLPPGLANNRNPVTLQPPGHTHKN